MNRLGMLLKWVVAIVWTLLSFWSLPLAQAPQLEATASAPGTTLDNWHRALPAPNKTAVVGLKPRNLP